MQCVDLLELENLFREIDSVVLDDIFDDDHLTDDPNLLGEDLVHSKSLVVACPNMPSWENAWWGEHALRALEESGVR